MERREAEVVEQVVAQLEVVQPRAREQQQQRLERRVALAERAAQRERALGIDVGADDRARPTVVGLARLRGALVGDGLPRIAAEVERLGQLGRRRVREQKQRLHHRLR